MNTARALRPAPSMVRQMPVPTAFACTHIAYPHDQPGLWLDRCTASTAMGALAWMRLRVRVTATELGGQAVHTAAAWLDDAHAQRAALEHLVTGRRMSCTLADEDSRYDVAVEPLYQPRPDPGSTPDALRPMSGRRNTADDPTPGLWRRLANCLFLPALVFVALLLALLTYQPK